MTQLGNPRPPSHWQDRLRMSFDFPNPGNGVAGVAASGSATFLADASMSDGDTLTLSDGFRTVVYEYDKSGNGVAGTNVSVAAGTTATSVAANFRTAILANQPAFTVVAALGVLTITNRWVGAGGNVSMVGTTTHVVVTGMASGADPTMNGNITADTTVKLHKVSGRSLTVERVMINLPAGLAQSATDYCNFKLLKGASTVVANWSTQTTTGNGSLAADTPTNLALSATIANLTLDDGDVLSLFVDVTGSPTVPAGRIVIEGHEI